MFWEWGGWALYFQWKSEGFPGDISVLHRGVTEAKLVPVEGPEQGLGRATKPAGSLAWLLAMGAMDPFAPGSDALQGWLWEGLESRPAELDGVPGDMLVSQASALFPAPYRPSTSMVRVEAPPGSKLELTQERRAGLADTFHFPGDSMLDRTG